MPLSGRLRFKPGLTLPALILGGSVVAAAGAWALIRQAQLAHAQARFAVAMAESSDRLESRLLQCENLIRGVRGLAQASGGLDRLKFQAYLHGMESHARYPGLRGITYLVPVAAGDRDRLLDRLRAEQARPGLQVQPGWGFPGDSLVILAEPEATNARVLGFNSASSPVQLASVLAARDSGAVEASPPMTVAQDPQGGPGLILRVAVYRDREVPRELEARRAGYAGCVNAVFLIRDLATAAFLRAGADGLRLGLVDLRGPGRPFMEGGGPRPAQLWSVLAPGGLHGSRELRFGGGGWRLEYQAGPSFFLPAEAVLPWLAGASCLAFGILLAGLVRTMGQTRTRAQELARRMTEHSRRSEARLRAILRVVPDVLLVYDLEGRYLEILNQDVSRLAAAPGSLLDHKVTETLPPEVAGRVLQTLRRALLEQREQSLDYALQTPRGELRFEARAIPMDPDFGDRPCVLWAARDVTEREVQAAAMGQSQKLESLGVLAGGIAHDFNNLLTAIQGHVCLGRLTLAEGGDPAPHLDHAEASIGLAADLARQLLAYSGRASFAIQPLDLNILLRGMATLLGVSRSKLVSLEVDLEPGLPCILADRVQVQQVVMNLVTNASEAIGERAGRVRLATTLTRLDPEALDQRMPCQALQPGPFVTLELQDDGEGMTEAVRARIFDPFFTTKAAGHGLGLSAIRGILATHRAGIEVQSKVGAGTTVTLHFPAVPGSEAPAADAGPGPLPREGAGTLLLAEDEPVIRELSTQMAERLGYQVLAAADGEEAWRLFQAHRAEITVVVLDLTMPRRSGGEVYGLVRNLEPRVPILLCSGYSREAVPEPRSPDEPRGFLQKPFTFAQLGTALRELMER